MNINDIIANDKEFPDGTSFVLGKDATGNDVTVTLGDLRGDYRSKDADYRRKTTSVADERRRLAEERSAQQVAFAEAEQKLAQWTKELMNANPRLSATEAEDELESDPRYKKLTSKLDHLEKGLAERDKKIDGLAKAYEDEQRNRWVQAHRATLASIQAGDKDLDAEELVRFAQDHGIPRLDDAYRLLKYDSVLEGERKKAVDEAIPKLTDKIKRELVQPVLPSTRLVMPNPESFVGPGAMDKAANQASQDPDIIRMLMGGSG